MTEFCKNETCPSSDELLDFQKREMPRSRVAEVNKHLAVCEFCAAELAFYSHYPQEEFTAESIERSEIPQPLFQLAEALLKNRGGDSSSLDSLLKEMGGSLILDKV